MYFNELEMTEYDTRSVPEGEFRDFCQFWPFNWQARANHASLSCLGVRRNAPPKWEVGLTKVFVFCHYGGPNWYFCYSYACCKTCVRVIYASFDPPLEIVSLGEIFQNLYPKWPL